MGVAPHYRPRQIATPSLVKPIQDLKVRIRKDYCQGMVRTPTSEAPRDVDTAFPIEKPRRVGHFVAR